MQKGRRNFRMGTKISLEQLVEEMINHDYKVAKKELFLKKKVHNRRTF